MGLPRHIRSPIGDLHRLRGNEEPGSASAADACRPGPRIQARTEDRQFRRGPDVFALLVVSAFDHRFGWSNVPTAVVLIGDLLVAVGLGITMLVVVQYSYAAANITFEADQKVVST